VASSGRDPAKADGGRIIDLPGGDLQVREDGPVNEPPIVLIHGWAASSDWFDPARGEGAEARDLRQGRPAR
jgi:pimeloyl-ACP methyl ester carboxylesterase